MKAENCRSYDLQFFEQLFLIVYANLLIDRVKVPLHGSFAYIKLTGDLSIGQAAFEGKEDDFEFPVGQIVFVLESG